MKSRFGVLILAACLTSPVAAQFPGPGLMWVGTASGSVGNFVPSCANMPVAAVRGETVRLQVWGDPSALYGLFVAAGGHQCLPFPGLGNALVLDFPVLTLGFGILTQTSPCLSCPPAFQELVFAIPLSAPPGAVAAFQAASFGAGNPSFTVAVTATVP